MSPRRIHTIKKIENYRIFQNWRPSGGVEFGRVNLIYGQNGSGKSTLASLLQGCAAYAADQSTDRDNRHDEIVGAGLQLDVWDPSETSTSGSSAISLENRDFWARVRVFNKDFVRRNLRFEEADGPQPEALLTIGERLADAEKKIKELCTELETKREDLPLCEKAVKSAKDAVDRKLKDTAKQVVDDLRTSDNPRYRATNTYTKRQVRELLEEDPAILEDASTELQADRGLAISKAKEPVYLQARSSVLEQDGLDEAYQLLATRVVNNQLIEELVGHTRRSRWVQDGIDLHEGLDECLFCGQELTAERINALNAHFDESVKKLQSSIDALLKRLDESVAASKTYLDAFPADSEIYKDLREDLQKARMAYAAEHKAYAKAVEMIAVVLKEKRDNPFGTPALNSDIALVAPGASALEKVVKDHQGRIDSHEEEAKKAADRVEHYYVKNVADEYVRLRKKIEDEEATCNELRTEVKDLEKQITALEKVDGDPIPGAKELTERLRGLLGRDELTLSVVEGSKRYAIERHGARATHLSEGEQTAIALLYFISSVRADKIQGEPPIVIIDDPVSSLDQGILFGASAHIWAELVINTYASQVFLLTHNFELFRQWLVQMEGVPKNLRKGGYVAYRIRSRCDVGSHRVSDFELWELDDGRRKKLRSQYHFLFDQVAMMLKDSDGGLDSIAQMEVAALVPNTARKLLEGFLSFRSPATMGNLHRSVSAALKERPGLDDSVRTMIVRYMHANSHLEEADPTKPLEISESVPFLKALFTFMDHVDRDHFRSMCEALGYDPDALLGKSTSLEEVPSDDRRPRPRS